MTSDLTSLPSVTEVLSRCGALTGRDPGATVPRCGPSASTWRNVHRSRAVGRRARRAGGLQAPLGASRPRPRYPGWNPGPDRARGRSPRGAGLRRPRHHRRHQRALQGKGARDRPAVDHGGLSRPPRDRPPEAPAPLRPLQADKPPALVPRYLRRESPRALRLGRRAWSTSSSLDEVREALDALKAEGVEAARRLLPLQLRGPHARAPGRGRDPQALPWAFRLAVRRRLAGVPRIRAPVHRGHQRLSRPARQPLPPALRRRGGAARHPLSRRMSTSRTAGSSPSPRPPSSRCGRCSPGPAAGVVGASRSARRRVSRSIITFDMGGTSTDVALRRGRPAGDRRPATIGRLSRASPESRHQTVGAGGGTSPVSIPAAP